MVLTKETKSKVINALKIIRFFYVPGIKKIGNDFDSISGPWLEIQSCGSNFLDALKTLKIKGLLYENQAYKDNLLEISECNIIFSKKLWL